MKKEEYLRKALLLVSNPYTKAQVQRELEDHIEAISASIQTPDMRGKRRRIWQ